MKKYYVFVLATLSAAIVTIVLLTQTNPATASDDDAMVTFSHATHAELAACADCHENAATSTSLTDTMIPAPSVCQNCHEEEDVRSYWDLDASADLSVVPVDAEPEELIFSHKFHTGAMKMECERCHTLTDDEMSDPTMESCSTCHNDGERTAPIMSQVEHTASMYTATNQCEACHANLYDMVPANHRVADFERLHGKMAMNGEADRDCAVCHSQSFCAECHTPTNGVPSSSTADDFYIDSWPRGEKMDDGDMLTVQRAHALTYRYTHGFDARIQSSRCQTCHEQESFCVECHQSGYDANGARIVPQTHMMAGWSSATGGRAMNRHGRMASMDIERCATCHYVDGGDPVCAMCHSTGVAGGEN